MSQATGDPGSRQAQSLDEINVVVCGVNNSQQLREIFVAATNGLKITSPEQFGLQDEILLNPALW